MKLRIVFEDDEGGWIMAYCPDLPGCISQGKGIAEARANIKEAIEGFLEVMAEDIIAENRKKAGNLDSDNSGDVSEGLVEAHYLLVESSLPEH